MLFYIPYLIVIPGIVELLSATSWTRFAAGLTICVVGFLFYAALAISGILSTKFTQPVINLPEIPPWVNQENAAD